MSDVTTSLSRFIDPASLEALIRRAQAEDLGPEALDVTSRLCVPATARREGTVAPREAGVLAGAGLLPTIASVYDAALTVTVHHQDGTRLTAGQAVATIEGPLRSLLTMERVMLNLLGHLSGIATLTAQYVDATAGTTARIYDTRKTLPGLRALQKYAVTCGGGQTHRRGLYDAMLIKDNHLATTPTEQLRDTLQPIIDTARRDYPDLAFIEVEVDTLDQLQQILPLAIDIALLDNMTLADLRRAVALRDRIEPTVALEASGGVTLEHVRHVAETGVDRIAIGALTHSAKGLDLGLDVS